MWYVNHTSIYKIIAPSMFLIDCLMALDPPWTDYALAMSHQHLEYPHGPAVGHRVDGPRDAIRLCWHWKCHGVPKMRHGPCSGPRQSIPGRDRAEGLHLTGGTSTSTSGLFSATAEHVSPWPSPQLYFPSWASCSGSFAGFPLGTNQWLSLQ